MTELAAPQFLLSLLMAAGLSAILVYAAMKLALGSGMLDHPGTRQSHTRPTPTGGGIGIVAAILVSSVLISSYASVSQGWMKFALPGAIVLSAVGWLDDRKHLSMVLRLFVQLAVSFALITFSASKGRLSDWPVILPGVIAMIWVMNSYNFMDGSHGMAGFQGLFSGLLLGVLFSFEGAHHLAVPAFLLAACCAGFLPPNFPRPRVFMGDAGSVPLGFMLAALVALGMAQGVLSPALSLLVLAVFLVDTSLTLFIRVIRGGAMVYCAQITHVPTADSTRMAAQSCSIALSGHQYNFGGASSSTGADVSGVRLAVSGSYIPASDHRLVFSIS